MVTQAPEGQCIDLVLQPAADGGDQPSAWLLTDGGLHVLASDSGLSASAVLAEAPLSACLEPEPDTQTQVGPGPGLPVR